MVERRIDRALVEQVQKGRQVGARPAGENTSIAREPDWGYVTTGGGRHQSGEVLSGVRAIGDFRGDSAFVPGCTHAINTAMNTGFEGRRPPNSDVEPETEPRRAGRDNATRGEHGTRELGDAVRALDALPADLRTAITLRELDGRATRDRRGRSVPSARCVADLSRAR